MRRKIQIGIIRSNELEKVEAKNKIFSTFYHTYTRNITENIIITFISITQTRFHGI